MPVRIKNNPKSASLTAIMKNPKLAKLVSEALDSPLGSTKREQAKALLGSIKGANKNFQDGQGGFPGIFPLAGQFLQSLPSSLIDFGKSIGTAGSIGTSLLSTGAQALGSGVSAVSESFGSGLGTVGVGTPFTPLGETAGAQKLTELFPEDPPPLTKKFPTSNIPKESLFNVPIPGVQTSTSLFTNLPSQPTSNIPKESLFTGPIPGIQTSTSLFTIPTLGQTETKQTTTEQTATSPVISGPKLDALKVKYPDADWDYIISGGKIAPKQFNIPKDINGLGVADTTFSDPTNGNITGFDDGILATKFPSLMQTILAAAEIGLGAESFATQVQGDKKLIDEIFADIPEDQRPYGASLARQLADLQSSLKDENKLDEQLANITSLTKRGRTVEKDLTNYIVSRDEYIKKLDGMIDDLDTQISKMDLSDPFVNKLTNNYRNYLHILRGRQEKRYADFLSDSIDQHNNEIQSAIDLYDITKNKFISELQIQAAITTEDFNNLRTMLIDMYNNVAGREAMGRQVLKEELDLYEQQIRIIADEAELLNPNFNIEKISTVTISEMERLLGYTGDKDPFGNKIKINPPSDLYGLMNQAEFSLGTGFGERIRARFYREAANDALAAGKSGNLSDILKFYSKAQSNLFSYAEPEGPRTAEEIEYDLDQIQRIVSSNMIQGLVSDYMLGENGKINDIRDALDDLVGYDAGPAFRADQEDKKLWVKRHKGDVNEEFLEALFDNYIIEMNTGQQTPEGYYNPNLTDEELALSIANRVVASWSI